MAITLAFDAQLARVRVTADLLGVAATYAVVDRSTDGVRWSVVRGGAMAAVTAGALVAPVDDYEFPPEQLLTYRVRSFDAADVQQAMFTGTITPTLAGMVWVKSIIRPFLNRPVVVVDFSPVTRRDAGGVFAIVGRSFPVAVTDVRGSRQYVLQLYAADEATAADVDLIAASGDPIFVQVPPGVHGPPGGYYAIGDTQESRTTRITDRRVFAWPLTEVAAPVPQVVGVTYTCQAVLNDYATCADVLAGNATIQDLLENLADAEDVIVP